MTKKDYIIISRSIAQVVRQYPEADAQKAIRALFVYLKSELYADNNKFDETKFAKACGLSQMKECLHENMSRDNQGGQCRDCRQLFGGWADASY